MKGGLHRSWMFIFSMPFFSRTALRVQRWMMRNTAVGRFRITSAASGSRTAGKGLSAASWKSSSAAIHTEKKAESMGRTRPGQGLAVLERKYSATPSTAVGISR